MSYVPIVKPTTRDASPRARELARQLEHVIQDFQRSYPDTRPTDIQQAVQIASGSRGSMTRRRRALVLAVTGGIAALGVLVFNVEASGGQGEPFSGPLVWLVLGVIVVIGLAAVAFRE